MIPWSLPTHNVTAYSNFRNSKWFEAILPLSAGWDAGPSQFIPLPPPQHFIGFPRQITVTHLNAWVKIAPRKKSVLSRNIAQCYNSKEETGGTQLLSRRSVDPLQDIALGHWHPDTWVSTIRECFCAPEIFILSVEECSILFYILLVIVSTTKCSDMDRNC